MELPEGTKFQVLAPMVRGRKGEYEKLLGDLARKGFPRARIDGEVRELSEPIRLPKNYKHTIEVVVDRLVAKPDIRRRVADSLETALELAEGIAAIAVTTHDGGEEIQNFSQALACTFCGLSFDELAPRNFSFNSPYGACQTCDGLGIKLEVDAELVVPDPDLTINEGAIAPWASNTLEYWYRVLEAVAEAHAFSLDTPWKKLPKAARDVVLYGSDERSTSATRTGTTGSARTTPPTRGCSPTSSGGTPRPTPTPRARRSSSSCARSRAGVQRRRAPPETLAVTVGGLNISQLTEKAIRDTLAFIDVMELSEREHMIAERLLKEIRARLGFLVDVGLDYLSLGRAAGTLAGARRSGSAWPRRSAAGSSGVLYVLDEPSIGLHQRDNRRLIDTLIRLRDLGNTLVVVEHDEATIHGGRPHRGHRTAGGGARAARSCTRATCKGLLRSSDSLTGAYLIGPAARSRRRRSAASRGKRRLRLEGASEHNLKNVTVDIPLGLFVCVTGCPAAASPRSCRTSCCAR